MSLEKGMKTIEEEEEKDESGSEAGSETGSLSEASGSVSEAGSDIANQSDFDISGDEGEDEEVEKNPEEEYTAPQAPLKANKQKTQDSSISHPASFKSKSEEEEEEEGQEDDDDDDEEDKNEEDYLQKFNKNFRNEFVNQNHPESNTHNYEEVKQRTLITRSGTAIIDGGHKTIPFLTKYEKTRVLGQRAKQINAGAKPLLDTIPANVIDGYLIAKLELAQKKIPFIIKRPLPNGDCEYWRLADLELID
jgi:DNA-directed RNA polymerase I, II, and III subunit RPABC2